MSVVLDRRDPLQIVADIEVSKCTDVTTDVIQPVYNAVCKYEKKVLDFKQSVEDYRYHNSRMKYAVQPQKYKTKALQDRALLNANKAKELCIEGGLLLYSIREKITGESIVFRTMFEDDSKTEVNEKYNIIEIDYKTLFSEQYLKFGSAQNYMKSNLRFINQEIIKYHQDKVKAAQQEQNNEEKHALYSWGKDVKMLYDIAIRKWNERNQGIPWNSRPDKFNRGHIFEYMDQVNASRQYFREHSEKGRRGVSPWNKEGKEEFVEEMWAKADQLFDTISFIKGGDTGAAQDKLLNGTIISLKGIMNIINGYNYGQYGSYQGIKKGLEEIKGETNKDKIIQKLMTLFTKQAELLTGLKNDMLQYIESAGVNNIKQYMLTTFFGEDVQITTIKS